MFYEDHTHEQKKYAKKHTIISPTNEPKVMHVKTTHYYYCAICHFIIDPHENFGNIFFDCHFSSEIERFMGYALYTMEQSAVPELLSRISISATFLHQF